MKKALLMLNLLVMNLNLFAQVRLTEVFPVNNKNQFIELYSKPGSGYLLDDYYILSYMKNSTTGTVTIYLIDFNAGVSPFTGTNSYVVYSKYAGDKVGSQNYVYTNFNTVSSAWKYTKTTTQTSFSGPVANPAEDYFSDSQAEMGVFLFKKMGPTATSATLVDFVTHVKDGGSQTTKHALITASLNALPSFTYAGVNFSFNGVLVSKAKHIIADPGSSSYNLQLVNCIPTWFKDNPTPWSGQLINAVPTWDAFGFYYRQTGTRVLSNIVERNYYSSVEIPKESLSYVNLVINPKPMSSNFECYISFRYLLDATIGDIRFSLYLDTDMDGMIDPGEPIVNGLQDIVPGDAAKLPLFTDGLENYYKINFSLTPQSPTAQLFYPVIIKTNYVSMTAGTTCTFSTTEQINFASDLALPVAMADFTVNYNREIAKLEWHTLSENNNRGFEVQRSVGNPNRWYPIAFLSTRAKEGNSSTAIAYTYDDLDLTPGIVHYYRLHQIDFDGKSTLSPVRSIKAGNNNLEMRVYPNPAVGDLTVFYSGTGTTSLHVFNTQGQLVRQMPIITGKNRLEKLPRGSYVLQLRNKLTGEGIEKKLLVHE